MAITIFYNNFYYFKSKAINDTLHKIIEMGFSSETNFLLFISKRKKKKKSFSSVNKIGVLKNHMS